MSSDESDDEPLAVLAAVKKLNPEKFVKTVPEPEANYERPLKRKIKNNQGPPIKKLPLTIKVGRKLKNQLPRPLGSQPEDVWLYLKDLNPNGPYSCLLCSEWFIGRSKVIVHYILNHKKDFCGICRYFVPDRAAWEKHVMTFHTPWPCSQCCDIFFTEAQMRIHLKSMHSLVHCRLCHFRIQANDQYQTHLLQKHNVSNFTCKDEGSIWELDYEGSPEFLCLLCSKTNQSSLFVNHYMSYHHFTLKCFSSMLSGKEIPFTVFGADLSPEFIKSLRGTKKCGYGDWDEKRKALEMEQSGDAESALKALLLEIKHETFSDTEEVKNENEEENEEPKNESEDENENSSKPSYESVKDYKGELDFDVTVMELVVINQFYFDYLNQSLADLHSKKMPENSNIDYGNLREKVLANIKCPLCTTNHDTVQTFATHMYKVHCVKSVPLFSCRVCATTFETKNELDNHIKEELGDFEDLWICQFCDKEFDNRESTRRHLTEHGELVEYDNCFSPHLGFKCKYCPTLFWNETDREQHQIKVHLAENRDQFYECECSEVFSDKVWFTYHYFLAHQKEESPPIYLVKCCLCSVVLPEVEQMRTHFSSKHPAARKFFCTLDNCLYRPLSHRKSFLLHLKTQHTSIPRKDKPCSCSICGQEFATTKARGVHIARAHGAGKYKCKICQEMLHSIDERKLHYLLRHPGHHPFECNVCGKSFQYKSSLYIHKRDHAPNKASYTCNYCQKVFAKKDSFREHVQIHEGPRHGCSYCPMRFVQRSNMLRHERRHTGERPYSCPHCDRKFADKGACTSHVRTHSKDASYACIYCGQTFAQKSKLTYHIRKHTGENLETCSICSKIFTSACSLREHMKTHEAKTAVSSKCPLCGKSYKDERYMLRHLRTVHTGEHFTCPLCSKTLTSAVGLRHHVLTHSRLNLFRCKCCTKASAVRRTMIKHLRRRHNLKSSESVNIRDFYKKLDPRECKLDLDEEIMTSIFGPPKKIDQDNVLGDFVEKRVKTDKAADDDDDENDEGSDDDSDNDKQSEGTSRDASRTGGEDELEPTDFVSVKIEPIDDDEEYSE